MVKHIVMWKLKDFAEGSSRIENAKHIKELLESLKDKIAEIKSIEAGININNSDSAYDVVLYSEFEDDAALEAYQNHPEHIKVADFIGKVKEHRVVVDYIV